MSNKHYDLELTAQAVAGDRMVEVTFDPYNDANDMDLVKDLLKDKWESEYEEDMPYDAEIKITDFGNTPSDYASEEKVFDFAEAFAECEQEMDVVEAALDLGIDAKNIDEAYQGEYGDDVSFAQETAEQLGEIDDNAKWPYTCIDWACIDWEWAARELMMDYSESNGHYFRNL